MQQGSDAIALQELVERAQREGRRIIVPLTAASIKWLGQKANTPQLRYILFTNSSSGDYPMTSLEQILRDFQKLSSKKQGANLILNLASILKHASRYESNRDIKTMKHIISQIVKRCSVLNLYDRNSEGSIVKPFHGYLFKSMPEKTASILYLHCLKEFPVIALRFNYDKNYINFIAALKKKQFIMNSPSVMEATRRLICYFFRNYSYIQDIAQVETGVTVDVQENYERVSEYIQTIDELKQKGSEDITTLSDEFSDMNIAKDIIPYIALTYDPIFREGYIFKEATGQQSEQDQLFNCLCGRVSPVTEFIKCLGENEYKAFQICNRMNYEGIDYKQCTQVIKELIDLVIPYPHDVCGPYARLAHRHIKNITIVTSRQYYQQTREAITKCVEEGLIEDPEELVNSHGFFYRGVCVQIEYYQSEQERILKVFVNNCSAPFLKNIYSMLALRNLQITEEYLLFDKQKNKYVQIKSEDDIFAILHLRHIPPVFRIGGYISQRWFDFPASGREAHTVSRESKHR